MSLHTVKPEKPSLEALLNIITEHYPALSERRQMYFGDTSTEVFIQIQDHKEYENNHLVRKFHVNIMDTYYGESWFGEISTISLNDALEKLIKVCIRVINEPYEIDEEEDF